MDEFALIKKYLSPLARGFPGSLNLSDDAAVIDIPAGHQLIVTQDTLNTGVHFIGNETPALLAKKALRVNLSDLAAMGAKPLCYFLGLNLPQHTKEEWIKDFAKGLFEDQKLFGIFLAGGDTTKTYGSVSLSITALGLVSKGGALKRNGAKMGDIIYVSGTLGDSALGLKNRADNFLMQRYQLPEPRIALGEKLRSIASACMDISDGLVQDLGHICTASKVGATVYTKNIPLSAAAKKYSGALEAALTGGDDYELLFTAPAAKENAIEKLSKELKLPITQIGIIKKGGKVSVLDAKEKPLSLRSTGYKHF